MMPSDRYLIFGLLCGIWGSVHDNGFMAFAMSLLSAGWFVASMIATWRER